MTPGARENKQGSTARVIWGRMILRWLGSMIAMAGLMDLGVAILAHPPASKTTAVSGGGTVIERHYSSRDLSLLRARDWFRTYLNPAGWIALTKGYGPDSLSQLERRSRRWRGALAVGHWSMIAALFMLAAGLWMLSSSRIRQSIS